MTKLIYNKDFNSIFWINVHIILCLKWYQSYFYINMIYSFKIIKTEIFAKLKMSYCSNLILKFFVQLSLLKWLDLLNFVQICKNFLQKLSTQFFLYYRNRVLNLQTIFKNYKSYIFLYNWINWVQFCLIYRNNYIQILYKLLIQKKEN